MGIELLIYIFFNLILGKKHLDPPFKKKDGPQIIIEPFLLNIGLFVIYISRW